MNKKGLFGFIFFMVLILLFISAFIFTERMENKDMKGFCEENGFTSYEKASSRWDNNLCIKIEDNYRVEKIFDKCGNKYCFVKVEVDE